VAQKVIIEINCPKGIKPIRMLGREGSIKGQKITLDMNHIYSEHEKYVLLEVKTPAYEKDALSIADVNIRYVDMKNNAEEKQSTTVTASLTRSREMYDNKQNKVVYADVVEQIAIENNEKALALRDKGQVDEAQRVLYGNTIYLRSNAVALDSKKLEDYAAINGSDAEAVQAEDWNAQRKSMREEQTTRRVQR
jgi:Ca-activated chloride channel family protein